MKLTIRQTNLLLEAWRRWLCFQQGKDLLTGWTGLGTRSEYKPVLEAGLMDWVSTPPDRCQGWLHLTPKGMEALRGLLKAKYAPDYNLV